MNATFRLAKKLEYLFICGIAGGFLGPFCFLMSQWFDSPAPPPPTRRDLIVVALMPLVSVGSCLILIAYRRCSVTLDDGGNLNIDTPFFERSINLPTLDSARWVGSKTGAVHLINGKRNTTVLLDYIEPRSRLELIRSLRALIPTDKQEGWQVFCYRVAIPLRKRIRLDEPLEPDEWRPSYRRTDVVFGLSMTIGFLITGGLAYACSLPQGLSYPLLLLPVWAVKRWFEVPGLAVLKKEQPHINALRIAFAFVIAATLTAILFLGHARIAGKTWWMAGITLAYLVVMLTTATWFDRQRKQVEADRSAGSAQLWDALEHGKVT
jgi:hypothetical protein